MKFEIGKLETVFDQSMVFQLRNLRAEKRQMRNGAFTMKYKSAVKSDMCHSL
jgi:hypothetical protein